MNRAEVKALRRRLEMTRQELADALGVTQTTVARWEIGLNPISEPTARLLQMMADMKKKSRKEKGN